MTPLTNPQTPQEVSYNDKHARTRSIIERTIGILKGRWMCLDTAGGKLLYKPEKCGRNLLQGLGNFLLILKNRVREQAWTWRGTSAGGSATGGLCRFWIGVSLRDFICD
uniref:DDE Tnp4 domain-containing protein n=1 Tax=Knipowitschia caucasica TaxID=637954 RepID=A0AAV2JX84_KNICA